MRFATIILLIAVLLAGGYVWYGSRQAEQVTVNEGTDDLPSEIDVPTAEGVGTLEDDETAPGAGDAAQETGDGAAIPAAEVSRLLTVEGYDRDRVMTLLEQSDLSDPVKMAMRSSLQAAGDDPDLLRVALDDLRQRLGLDPA